MLTISATALVGAATVDPDGPWPEWLFGLCIGSLLLAWVAHHQGFGETDAGPRVIARQRGRGNLQAAGNSRITQNIYNGDYYEGNPPKERTEEVEPELELSEPEREVEPDLPPAPQRLVHNAICRSARLTLHWGDLPNGQRDRITRCETCKAELVDGVAERMKEAGLVDWSVAHGVDPDFGGELGGIWLLVGTIGGDKRKVLRCEVTGPYEGTASADLAKSGSVFADRSRTDSLMRMIDKDVEALIFPGGYEFGNAPNLPFGNGEYRVTWFLLTDDLGEQVLKKDYFKYEDGRLVQ